MRIEAPRDPRAQPVQALRNAIPLLSRDTEEQAERKMLRRMDIREAVAK